MNGVMGMNRRNVDLVMGKNRREYFPLVDNKITTKEILKREGFATAETIAICDSFFHIDSFIKKLQNYSGAFVLKPARGFGGEGILIVKGLTPEKNFNCGSQGIIDVDHLKEYIQEVLYGVYSLGEGSDILFAEAFIIAHEKIAHFAVDGLPDIRVITYDGVPAAAMIRVPTKESEGKANLHAGGCAAAIDIKTGITGDGWYKGKKAALHPEQKYPFSECQIPFWNEILDISKALFTFFPLGYMGIDFTIDAILGPAILELNGRPGLEIQNVCGVGMEILLKGLTNE